MRLYPRPPTNPMNTWIAWLSFCGGRVCGPDRPNLPTNAAAWGASMVIYPDFSSPAYKRCVRRHLN